MSSIQKFVMVPFHKYKRLTESRVTKEEDTKESQENPAPPPGMPDKPTGKRWLTLPEVE
jgi:hypothetical protein